MLIVILLDWNEPWNWLRQLRDWIRFLRSLLIQLDDDCKDTMEESINNWKNRGQSASSDAAGVSTDEPTAMPLGPGEWDEPLGIPLCVVCQNADKIEKLEQERGWKEEEFDVVLQYLRTVLLKHGASLIYTMPSQAGSLPALVHSWLGLQEASKMSTLRHNVVDRDRVLIPPHWDSWGKIRLLREGFDIEQLSGLWSNDIRLPEEHFDAGPEENQETRSPVETIDSVSLYEQTVRDPMRDPLSVASLGGQKSEGVDVAIMDNQEFLKQQSEVLEKLRLEDEESRKSSRDARQGITRLAGYNEPTSNLVSDHIGQVQFNMGGIQVDAEEMLAKISVSIPPFA
jgi:dynein light intermediate chain 1, cytosolic